MSQCKCGGHKTTVWSLCPPSTFTWTLQSNLDCWACGESTSLFSHLVEPQYLFFCNTSVAIDRGRVICK